MPKRGLPTICFDSAICINQSKGLYPVSEWRSVWKFVVSNYHYAIIPLVQTELILGVARGDEAHFEDNRNALKVLWPTHEKRFLDMPGLFAVETILKRRPTGGDFPSPATFEDEAHIMLSASSKASLISGRVQTRKDPKYSRGMDFALLQSQMDAGQNDHITTLQQLRAGHLTAPPASEWARLWMLSLGVAATPAECAQVAGAMDAAYLYECFLWNEARQGRYDFSKHASDWIDSQLLYYLADPTIHLIIHDRKLKHRIAGSTQANRVFGYADFVALATAPPPVTRAAVIT